MGSRSAARWTLTQLDFENRSSAKPNGGTFTAPLLGIYCIVTLIYFSVSAPAVIARWTEADYTLIVTMISFFLWLGGLSLNRLVWIELISPRILLLWNLLLP